MPGKRSKSLPLISDQLPVNSEVYVKGHEEDIGKGIVQGRTYDEGLPIVRFWLSNISKSGEKYLVQIAKCITNRANHSALYIIDKAELVIL